MIGRGYSHAPVHVCTVINKAWLAHARALAESLRIHEPDAQLTVLIVDSLDGFVDPAAEPFEILGPEDLQLAEFDAMSARYDITELCCALKPAIIRHLLDGDEPIVYLDSDVRVFGPLDGLTPALAENAFLLTPHLLAPLEDDGFQPSEAAILIAGSSNLGFAAARATPSVQALLSWWSDRLRTGSRLDPAHGMVYDQRWTYLMPGMFEHVGRWRDPGGERRLLARRDESLRVARRIGVDRRLSASHLSLHRSRGCVATSAQQVRQSHGPPRTAGPGETVRRVRRAPQRARPRRMQRLAVRVRDDGERC